MRFIGAIAFVLLVCSLLFWQRPDLVQPTLLNVKSELEGLAYDKEVRISGNQLLSEDQVQALLPLGKSVAWWRLHAAEAVATLEAHPLVQSARIETCPDAYIRCFEVKVLERQPSFLARLGEKVWLIGDDGGFITPVPKDRLSSIDQLAGGRLPVWVDGVLSENASPDTARARIGYVRQLIDTVEPAVGLSVERVVMQANGESHVRFRGLNLLAVFDVTEPTDMKRLSDEALRLGKLLTEFGDRRAAIERVDLAFNKVAVVKLAGSK